MNATAMKNRIKDELVRRFKASKAKNQAIVIKMKSDNVTLIIIPDWCVHKNIGIHTADMFTVYTDVREGRLALPYMCATSLDELSSNIMGYSGIDFQDTDERFKYLMNQAQSFVPEYDMYDDATREQIQSMQKEYYEQH